MIYWYDGKYRQVDATNKKALMRLPLKSLLELVLIERKGLKPFLADFIISKNWSGCK